MVGGYIKLTNEEIRRLVGITDQYCQHMSKFKKRLSNIHVFDKYVKGVKGRMDRRERGVILPRSGPELKNFSLSLVKKMDRFSCYNTKLILQDGNF